VRIIQLWRSKISASIMIAQAHINTPSCPPRKRLTSNHFWEHILQYSFPHSTKDTYSHVRGFSAGTTPVLLTFRCSVFLAGSIGNVHPSVAENPHHTSLSPELLWIHCILLLFLKYDASTCCIIIFICLLDARGAPCVRFVSEPTQTQPEIISLRKLENLVESKWAGPDFV